MVRSALLLSVVCVLPLSAQAGRAGGTASVAGIWRYEVPALKVEEGSKVMTCVVRDGVFILKQSGSSLSGSTYGGTFTCGTEPAQAGTPAPIDSGRVQGDSVIFWVATLLHRGRLVGDTISGQMAGKTDVPMSGAFRMIRK